MKHKTNTAHQPLYGSQPTHNPPNTRGNVENTNTVDQLAAVKAWGKRPAPIPNPEAKPHSADGTAPGRVWESRTPPQHNNTRPPQTHMFEGAKQHPQTQHTNNTNHPTQTNRRTGKRTHNTRRQTHNPQATTLVLVKEITPKTVQGLTLVPLFP